MWTRENRSLYERKGLRYPSDQPDLGGPAVMREFGRFDRPVAVIGA